PSSHRPPSPPSTLSLHDALPISIPLGINPNHGDTDALAAAELGEWDAAADRDGGALIVDVEGFEGPLDLLLSLARDQKVDLARIDRKSTRLNSSHVKISYAVFCL